MRKRKYERINYQMIIEDTFTDYLTEKATQGWVLSEIKGEQVIFKEEEPQDIKYQIEYEETDYDYDDFLKDMGYEAVCTYKNMIVYKNDNKHAPDLHTDDYVRLQGVKNMISKHPVVTFFALFLPLLPVLMIISLSLNVPWTLGGLFKSFEILIFVLFLLVITLSLFIVTLQSLLIKNIVNRLLENKTVDYKWFNRINKLQSLLMYPFMCIYPIAIIAFIPMFIKDYVYYFIYITSVVVIILGSFHLAKLMTKYRIEKKFISVMIVLIIIVTVTLVKK